MFINDECCQISFQVFRAVNRALPSPAAVEDFVADFEIATWRAIQSVFPAVQIHGCAFHWSQAMWRKIQELGLAVPYTRDHGTHTFLRKVMALPFLPSEHITPAFHILEGQATPPLQPFMEYVSRTWVRNNVWTPASLSVFQRPIRTNNDVEGYHRRLNHSGRPGMKLYILVPLLHREASRLTLQVRLVSDGKLRRKQRKIYGTVQKRLFEAWAKYAEGQLSASRLLRTCSKVYATVE